jgi:hypothetical protein
MGDDDEHEEARPEGGFRGGVRARTGAGAVPDGPAAGGGAADSGPAGAEGRRVVPRDRRGRRGGGAAESGDDCGNCAEYLPDRNGDGFGACTKVEGYVDPADWCVLWESAEEHEAEER